jgi:hypothetical protein
MSDPLPQWIRMPAAKKLCPFTSLRRGVLDRLCVPSPRNGFKAPVKSRSLREPGQKRATRLIHLPSLLAYLDAPEPAAEQAETIQ